MNVSSILNTPDYTSKGNKYNKYRGGKIVGAALASTYSAVSIARNKDWINSFGISKPLLAISLGIGVAIYTLFGTGIGAIVDAVINSTRKSKADKEALAQKEDKPEAVNEAK